MMAHTCPCCGRYCNCRGDFDDMDFGYDRYCECDCEETDSDWEDVDDEWDEEVEEAFKESKYTKDGGIIDPDTPNTIHYPCTKN